MNKSIKGSLVTGLLVMCLMSNVYATDSNKIINKLVLGSEESTFVSSIQKEVEENIEVTFRNKGATIPEYKLEKIFDKFYRADESRGTNSGGAGLGLAITKEIIELHNGTISANSEDETIEFVINLRK